MTRHAPRECPVQGCNRARSPGRWLCLSHWQMVSPETRSAIAEERRQIKTKPASKHLPHLNALCDLRNRAIAEAEARKLEIV